MKIEEKNINRIVILEANGVGPYRITLTIEPISEGRELIEIQCGESYWSVVWKPMESDFLGATSLDFIRLHSAETLAESFGGDFYRRTPKYWEIYRISQAIKDAIRLMDNQTPRDIPA